MREFTTDDAREQLRLAREALRAVGGELPKASAREGGGLTCGDLYTGAAVLTWFAAEAALQGGDYEWYLNAAATYETAAVAQGC